MTVFLSVVASVAAILTIAGIATGFFKKAIEMIIDSRLGVSRDRFLAIRKYLLQNRDLLTQKIMLYYKTSKYQKTISSEIEDDIVETTVLSADKWIPDKPFPLDNLNIELVDDRYKYEPDKYSSIYRKAKRLWPYKTRLSRFPTFHEAIETLDKPKTFENRITFILDEYSTDGLSYKVTFRLGKYFDHIDSGEALAFELAKHTFQLTPDKINKDLNKIMKRLENRKYIGDPTDFEKRGGAVGVNTLTVFNADSIPRFIMHHRHGDKVALAGEMIGLVPAGEFQPAMPSDINENSPEWRKIVYRDFDVWRNIMREANEEILGAPEIPYPDNYLDVFPYNRLVEAKDISNSIKVYFLGFILDPLSLKPDILTAWIFHGESFSELFSDIFAGGEKLVNAEGNLILGRDNIGIPFDAEHVKQYVDSYPTFPSGKACLILTWQNRHELGIKTPN